MAGPTATTPDDERPGEARRLVRLRRLLAEARDRDRVIVGRVSAAWLAEEVERHEAVGRLRPVPRWHRESGLTPDVDPATRVNTNRLPKLEPALAAHVLTGALLAGTRQYGRGTPDAGAGVACAEMGNDLILAAMAIDGSRAPTSGTIGRDVLAAEIGADVAERRDELEEALAAFDGGRPVGSAALACAIAAIEASWLRLVARAAGDAAFSVLSDSQRAELIEVGIDPEAPGERFPELPFLRERYERALRAVELHGVDDETLRAPIAGQLLRVVANVLSRDVPPAQLSGRYGDAVRHFHQVLPLMSRYSASNRRTIVAHGRRVETEGMYALATLHVTGLELTRYLHKARRKAGGTAAAHSFLVSARLAEALPDERLVPAIAAADCHDVVEDGGVAVTGYDQSLALFAARFGAPLAALVAEVTDSITRADGPLKAATFAAEPRLRQPEELYDVGAFEELRTVATDPGTPYSLVGALLKLADVATTWEETLASPHALRGVWRHSGAPIHWDLYSKGLIVRPIVERLVAELERNDAGAATAGMRRLVSWWLATGQAYARRNLDVLAGEHDLDCAEHDRLVGIFGDDRPLEEARAALDDLLDDARLAPDVRRRGWSATARLGAGGEVTRDLDKLLDYRSYAAWRRDVGRRLMNNAG